MKLAVNFSNEAENLIKNNAIQVDMFKFPDFSKELIDQVLYSLPCYVHFGLNAGNGQIQDVNRTVVHELRSIYDNSLY